MDWILIAEWFLIALTVIAIAGTLVLGYLVGECIFQSMYYDWQDYKRRRRHERRRRRPRGREHDQSKH